MADKRQRRASRAIAPTGWDEVNPGGNEQSDSDSGDRGAWVGLLPVAFMLSLTVWLGVQAVVWAFDADAAWLAVLLWLAFAVICAMFLGFLAIGFVVGVPWVVYLKRGGSPWR